MHHCLKIPEIRSLIFLHFHRTPDHSDLVGECEQVASTLAKLARTCRAFTEPALDVLWQYLTSLSPLIKVMPSDAWVTYLQAHRRYVKFARPLEESDWPRFDYYAQKVQRLGFYTCGMMECHADRTVIPILSASRPVRTFLPNLRRILLEKQHPTTFQSFLYMPCLLGLKTIHITLSFIKAPENFNFFCSMIPWVCPNIQTLVVEWDHASRYLPPDLDNMIRNLHHLHYLDISIPSLHLSNQIIYHLMSLQTLRSMRTLHMRPDPDFLEIFTANYNGFHNLRDFAFTTSLWDTARAVVDAMRCSFVSLAITIVSNPDAQSLPHFGQLMRSLFEHPSRTSLVHLEIRGNVVPDSETGESGPPIALRQLLDLTAVQTLYLDLSIVVTLDNSWLADAAAAWPNLQHLTLRARKASAITLSGFIPLIKQCPHLKKLDVTSVWRAFDIGLLCGAVNTNIEEIDMYHSGIVGKWISVFRCLVVMFPKLKQVRNIIDLQLYDESDWRQLRDVLPRSLPDQDSEA